MPSTKPFSRRALPGLTVKSGYIPHPFDLANGVRTSGLVVGRHLKTGHAHDRHATAYYGVAPSVFHRLLTRWRRLARWPVEQTTFVDVGAGMGRAVLLACEQPFRRVLGMELHPALLRTARRNLALWRKAGRASAPATMKQGDAVSFSYPAAPTLLFLFNPFGGVVMRRLLRALAKQYAERPGQLDVLYVNNEQDWVFEQQRGYTRLISGQIRRSVADEAADRRILNSQPDGEYASAPYEDCSIWRWRGVSS